MGVIEVDTRFSDNGSYGIYLCLKVVLWEPLWALSIYYIAARSLWDCIKPRNRAQEATGAEASVSPSLT